MRRLSSILFFALLSSSQVFSLELGDLAVDYTHAPRPRMILAQEQFEIRVTAKNTGRLTWTEDEKDRLSCRWRDARALLTEEASCYRTRLKDPVPSGQSVATKVRLRTPAKAGLYRLQLDLVRENVAWTADLDPDMRWESHYVLVLPASTPTVLPWAALAFVVLCLMLRRRFPILEGAAHGFFGLWVFACLFYRQQHIFREIGLMPSFRALTICFLVALAVVGLSYCLPRRSALIIPWCLVAFYSLLCFSDIIYLRFFDDVGSTAALDAGGQVPDVFASVWDLTTSTDIWRFIDLVPALVLVIFLSKKAVSKRWSWALVLAVVTLMVGTGSPSVLKSPPPSPHKIFARANLIRVETIGLLPYHAEDFWNGFYRQFSRGALSSEEEQAIAQWFRKTAPARRMEPPWGGIAKGRNLILVQVESMQDFVLGYTNHGVSATPNLDRLAKTAMVGSLLDESSMGRTSDGELTAMTSLLPLSQGTAAFRHAGNQYTSLGGVLLEAGYSTTSAIPFDPTFWNRHLTHQAWGFEERLVDKDFAPGINVGWGLNDRDFLQQMLPRLEKKPQPFFSWLITLSLHHPYDGFPPELEREDLPDIGFPQLESYFQAMSFLDRAFNEFWEGLEERGLLQNSVIALYGDHDAGITRSAKLAKRLGVRGRALDWYLLDSVPLIIWVPGEDLSSLSFDTGGGQTDITPTLLALLGIDPTPYAFTGRNLLNGEFDSPAVIMPGGRWIHEGYLFATPTPQRKRCFQIENRKPVEVARCDALADEAIERAEVSEKVLVFDLQEKLRSQILNP